VTEKSKIEFRAEFFNIFNFVNFAQPNNNQFVETVGPGNKIESNEFGSISQTNAGPRIIQFALKYNF
jgi:hypothetical protein